MTVAEVFAELSQHMIQGIMTHQQFSLGYTFLGLKGYAKCHDYHYLAETALHRKLNCYYINHYNKLIEELRVENPKVIPDSWFRYTRQAVDPSTKQSAVKAGLEKWEQWETETKELYQRMYTELFGMGEIAAAKFVESMVCDVDHELKKVQKYRLNKIATSYDMSGIVCEQMEKYNKYKCKMEKIEY